LHFTRLDAQARLLKRTDGSVFFVKPLWPTNYRQTRRRPYIVTSAQPRNAGPDGDKQHRV
jgi:hypothetical protein